MTQGELYYRIDNGSDPLKSDGEVCGGSSLAVAGGSLRQRVSLPTYRRQGRDYGVTFTYDSALGTSRRLGRPAHPNGEGSGVVNPRGLAVSLSTAKIDFFCGDPGGGAGSDLCSTGSGCFGVGIASIPFGAPSLHMELFGNDIDMAPGGFPASATGISGGFYFELPTNADGTLPAPGYLPVNLSMTLRPTPVAGGATCTDGGDGFDVAGGEPIRTGFGTPLEPQARTAGEQSPLVPTDLEPGPAVELVDYQLVYHRRSSPFGSGWGIEQVSELFRAPHDGRADVVHGDGHKETFLTRAFVSVIPSQVAPTEAVAFARDPITNEKLFYDSNAQAVYAISPDDTVSVVANLGVASPWSQTSMAVAYVGNERRFILANRLQVLEVNEAQQVTTLAIRNDGNPSPYYQPNVAAIGERVYFSLGEQPHRENEKVRMVRLDDPSRTVVDVTAASGVALLDPEDKQLAGTVVLTNPRGMAAGADGSLYVAASGLDAVYRLFPDANGEVTAGSVVHRVVGSGRPTTMLRLGDQQPGLRFPVDRPLSLSMTESGYLQIRNVLGVAVFDTMAETAHWLALTKTGNWGETNLTIEANDSFLAESSSSFLTKDSQLFRARGDLLSSEYEPTRTLVFTDAGARVTDTSTDVYEDFTWTDPRKQTARLVSVTARTGEALFAVEYDVATGNISGITDPTGGAFAFTYDGAGKLDYVADAAGRVTNVAVIDGDLTELVLATGETDTFDYDEQHYMLSHTDASGQTTTYVFAEDGTLESATRPGGAVTIVTAAYSEEAEYGADGVARRRGSIVDARGVLHDVLVGPDGGIQSDTYSGEGVTYEMRNVYAGNYAGATAAQDRRANLLRIQRSELNGLPATPDFFYDSLGRLNRIRYGAGGYSTQSQTELYGWEYDANGRPSVVDPIGNPRWVSSYDPDGRLALWEEQQAGSTTRTRTFTWRPDGQPVTATAHGVTTSFTYDPVTGNVLTASDITGSASFSYDSAGNVTRIDDGTTFIEYEYDSSNRVTLVRDARGFETTMGYFDPSCNCSHGERVTSLHTPDLPPGATWTLAYDEGGRPESVTDPNGHTELRTYAPTGEVTSFTDRKNRTTIYTYDSLGRPATTSDPAGRISRTIYPVPTSGGWIGHGLLVGSPDATEGPSSPSASLADGQFQIGFGEYKPAGTPPQIELYRDATVSINFTRDFDVNNRLVTRTGGGIDQTWGYDTKTPAALLAGYSVKLEDGTLPQAILATNDELDLTDASGGIGPNLLGSFQHYTRDVAGRVTTITHLPIAILGQFENSYQYNAAGQVTATGNSLGGQGITYDERGQVASRSVQFSFQRVGWDSSRQFAIEPFVYTYDEAGRVSSISQADGRIEERQYDELGRLVSRCYQYAQPAPDPPVRRCYGAAYDAVGNPVLLTDPEGASRVAYDVLDRVTDVFRTPTGGSEELEEHYEYNAMGGFSYYVDGPVDDKRPALDGSGLRASGVPSTHSGQPVVLDTSRGVVTEIDGRALGYSSGNEFVSVGGARRLTDPVTGLTSAHEFWQNGINYIIHDGPNIGFVANPPPSPVVADKAKDVIYRVIYDQIDHPIWAFDNDHYAAAISYYFELDTVGNVRRIWGDYDYETMQEIGQLYQDFGGYRYTAFGKQINDELTPVPRYVPRNEDLKQPFRWQGRPYYEVALGMYDFRTRFWSPDLGIFVQPDEFAFKDPRSTLWGWPGQNPFRYRDPWGLSAEIQSALDRLSAIPIVGYLFAGPAAWGRGFQNRLEGTIKLSRSGEACFEEGMAQRALGNIQIQLGGELTVAVADILVSATSLLRSPGAPGRWGGARIPEAPCNCFAAGTTVQTEAGAKPIEQVQVGEHVLAREPETGEYKYEDVLETYITPGQQLAQVTLVNPMGQQDIITTTPEHPFWVEGQGWVAAMRLEAGTLLTTAALESQAWTVASAELLPEVGDVYNFNVADAHTYFVGDSQTWVHNASCVAAKLLNTARGNLLSAAQNGGLRNLIKQMYRSNARIGSGSTADAIRHELATSQLLSPKGHFIKGQEMRTALGRLLKSGNLGAGDQQIARQLLGDLQRALSGQ